MFTGIARPFEALGDLAWVGDGRADHDAVRPQRKPALHSKGDGPDFALLEQLIADAGKPVIGEGRFWTPEDVRRGFALGAHGIVVGTAITNPREVTKRFKRLAAS